MRSSHAVIRLGSAIVAGILSVVAVSAMDEIAVEIPAGDHLLAGTLTLPSGEGPFPGAVLISGSGPSDRDESLPGVSLKPFARLAHELADLGVATLRYDDRGVGLSTGDFLSATSFDFADDANAAFEVLASRSEIDGAKVGLIGHSEGGMIAPHAAVENPDVAFVVTLAGTAVSGYDLLAEQLRRALLVLPEADREAAFNEQIHSLDLVVEEDWAGIETMLRADPEANDEVVAHGLTYYRGWLHTFVTHSPADDWKRYDGPVLALLGALDTQVDAEINSSALKAALARNIDTTVVVLPTANHLFQAAETGAMSEYGSLPDNFVEGFSETIANWIMERTGD